MGLDPIISGAICCGTVVLLWAIVIYILFRNGTLSGKRLPFLYLSIAASLICLFIFLQVPDWRLMWIRWRRHDFCALPGHAALYWDFIETAKFAFLAPVFAYLAVRLALTRRSLVFSSILFSISLVVLLLALHGLYFSSFWPQP
jgi:hypothetical protein